MRVMQAARYPDPLPARRTSGGRLDCSPLAEDDIEALAQALWQEAVYRHIGGLPAQRSEVSGWLRRTLAGPSPEEAPQRWLNYVMRRTAGGEPLGLLQATLHDGIAELAFLLAPSQWGQGLATEGLLWLHEAVEQLSPGVDCWATTLPANERSWRLLARCGYRRIEPAAAPALMTYDEGDWVFHRERPQGAGGSLAP